MAYPLSSSRLSKRSPRLNSEAASPLSAASRRCLIVVVSISASYQIALLESYAAVARLDEAGVGHPRTYQHQYLTAAMPPCTFDWRPPALDFLKSVCSTNYF